MGAVIAALAIVTGLVVAAIKSTTRPVKNIEWAKIRLAHLARKPVKKLTLDEAEDGVVLSRRLGQRDMGKEFAKHAARLRKKRPVI